MADLSKIIKSSKDFTAGAQGIQGADDIQGIKGTNGTTGIQAITGTKGKSYFALEYIVFDCK